MSVQRGISPIRSESSSSGESDFSFSSSSSCSLSSPSFSSSSSLDIKEAFDPPPSNAPPTPAFYDPQGWQGNDAIAGYRAANHLPIQDILLNESLKRGRRKRSRSRSSLCSDQETAPLLPDKDWECGLCGNLNSSEREECFRCGVAFCHADRRHSAEICVVSVPSSCSPESVVRALYSVIKERRQGRRVETEGVEDIVITDACRHQRRGSKRGSENNASSSVFVRFRKAQEAMAALQLLHCRLVLPNEKEGLLLHFSSGAHTRASKEKKVEESKENALPPALQHDAWEAPQTFETAETEKRYLDLMSLHWERLSDAQKRFYDERVKAALAKKAAAGSPDSTEPKPQAGETNITVAPPISAAKDSDKKEETVKPASSCSTLEQLKAAIAKRKGPAASAGTTATTTTTITTAAAPVPPPVPASPSFPIPSFAVPSARGGGNTTLDAAQAIRDFAAGPEAGNQKQRSANKSEDKWRGSLAKVPLHACFHGLLVPPLLTRDSGQLSVVERGEADESWKSGEFEMSLPIARRMLAREVLMPGT